MLEALACGSFPIAGDIESIREWIKDGENGMLRDPARPEEWSAAIVRAIKDKGLRSEAFALNQSLILERAERSTVASEAAAFYQAVLSRDE